MLGPQIGLAHPGGSIDEVGEEPCEPSNFDDTIGVEQLSHRVPLGEVAADPSGHQVVDRSSVGEVGIHSCLRFRAVWGRARGVGRSCFSVLPSRHHYNEKDLTD